MKEKKLIRRPTEYQLKKGGRRPNFHVEQPIGKKIKGRDHKRLQPWQTKGDAVKMDITQHQTARQMGQANTEGAGWTGKIIKHSNVTNVKTIKKIPK